MGEFEVFDMPVSLGTMIYQAVLFTILIFILKRNYLSKIVEVLEKRRAFIEEQLKTAEMHKTESQAQRSRQKEFISESQEEAMAIISHAREEAGQIIKSARKEAIKIRSEAYEELQKELDAS